MTRSDINTVWCGYKHPTTVKPNDVYCIEQVNYRNSLSEPQSAKGIWSSVIASSKLPSGRLDKYNKESIDNWIKSGALNKQAVDNLKWYSDAFNCEWF